MDKQVMGGTDPNKPTYEFGFFRLDTGSRLLLRDGVAVSLTLKSYELLAVLVENWGKVLEKDKLMELVWPNSFVEEANLSHHIYLLRKVLGDDRNGSTYIETIPKRGYRFVTKVQELPVATAVRKNQLAQGFGNPAAVSMGSSPSSDETSGSASSLAGEGLKEEADSGAVTGESDLSWPARRTWVWAGAAVIVVVMTVVVWLTRGTARKLAAAPEVVPLTSYVGWEGSPNFSPDGNQVAFSWNGEKQDNYDIYVKLIGSSSQLQLTTDPADDVSPAFSPDGRSIGFVRVWKERAVFIIIPSIGGPERVVADIAVPRRLTGMRVFSWLPDGKWVVIEGLTLLSTETGEQRSLTSPPPKWSPDYSPAVSPDGRTVAFSREAGFMLSNIYLLDLTHDLKPNGEPRQLTSLRGNSHVPAWTPDGQEIIFASADFASGIYLWRVRVSAGGKPEQLPITGGGTDCPAISRSGNRLAYQQNASFQFDIWRLPLSGGVASGPPSRFIPSTRHESAPEYSPDGKRIAFESNRSGNYGIWVCDADGTHAVELFSEAGVVSGGARWSPDGQRVAFLSNVEGNYDVCVIRASGGKPIRLTNDPADDFPPSWSRDGMWVYFGSKRTGQWETWKVRADGGEAVQVTRNGGQMAFESPDGRFIYYTKEYFSGGRLWKMLASGGEESQVLPSVAPSSFSVANDGIYFIPEPGADSKSSIQFLSFATGKVKTVAAIRMSKPPTTEGLSVSADGRFLLFSQADGDVTASDLMLVENFQ